MVVRAWKCLTHTSVRHSCFAKIVVVAYVIVQLLDGVYTYIGVSRLGISVELNPLVGWAMTILGVGFGLVVVKFVTTGFGALIYYHGYHNLLALITAFYMAVVILTWMYLFLVV